MNIGELNQRIKILKKDIIIDANGFEVESWIEFKTVWGKIKNINGREFFQAQQIQSKATKKATIRYIENLDTSIHPSATIEYKIQYKNNTYNIGYSDNIKESNNFLELLLEGE